MTPTEAAALAILGARDRRLLAALVRAITGQATTEDHEALPLRLPDEPLIQWACRCRPQRRDSVRTRMRVERLATGLKPVPVEPVPAALEAEATAQLEQAARLGAAGVPLSDARYPSLLASIPDPPPLLWIRGLVDTLAAPAIALVGSRTATPHGMAMSDRLSRDLATAGLVIVSGLARGIDSAAHAAALSVGGQTIGVLGCGIDRVYPSEHRDLARNIEHAGAVVSEYPPGVPPLAHHFPQRNRIISGLAAAVVVVEAPEKSGALITAAAALEQGRDVMAVPGPTTGGRNRGGHLLIRDGATVVESADDILQALGLVLCAAGRPAVADAFGQLPESTDFTVDEVAVQTGELPSVVLARLLDLELAGRIRRIGGGRFVRVGQVGRVGG
jgi:DNA processing protein